MRWLRFRDTPKGDVLVNVDRINNIGVDTERKELVIDNFYIEVPLSDRANKTDVLALITDALAKYPQDNSVIDMCWLSKE